MEKTLIYYKPEVVDFINQLVFDLYQKEYFGFLDDAIQYKDKLIDFIEKELPNFPYRHTPFILRNFGSKYIFYKANYQTSWYIFFENRNNEYLITFITNNHNKIAKFL